MWKAIYNDGTMLPQFEENIEHLFSEIDHSKLGVFRIDLPENGYAVSLDDGSFSIGGARFKFDGYEKEKFTLIYFRRIRRDLGGDSEPIITHHLGWQIKGSDQNKSNRQRIMTIREDTEEVKFQIK